MEFVREIDETRAQVRVWVKEGRSIGLVPTMGYLHEGHGSLIKRAREENDRVVVSLFVNPTQFGPGEDLADYPRDPEKDRAYCESLGADLLFAPEPEEMYPEGFSTYVDMTVLTEELCGLSRPTHFRGVCTVLSKLFHIVSPNRAYFGEKDAQQLAVVRHMVEDLNMDLEIVGCPIVREEDGLAMSSRNTYLSPQEREAALILSKAVSLGEKMVAEGERDAVKLVDEMKALIGTEPLARIDYVKAVDGRTMQPVEDVRAPLLVAMAVYIGDTRLIDNFMIA